MTTPAKIQMTVNEFLAWAEGRPGRFELHEGQVVAMSPERVGHAKVKFAIQRALADVVAKRGLDCHVLPDGVAVKVSETTFFEPDAMLYCGSEAPRDSIQITNPLIVVEVLSPSTQHLDISVKLAGYFSIASVSHYLIVNPEGPPIVHHHRQPDGQILTRIVPSGLIDLTPPGISIDTAAIFN